MAFKKIQYTIFLICLLNVNAAFSSIKTVVEKIVVPQVHLRNSIRYSYYMRILTSALNANMREFGPYELVISKDPTKESFLLDEIRNKKKDYSLGWGAAIKENSKNLQPLQFPLHKGTLGYRVFLTKNKFSLPNGISLRELRKIPIASGLHWPDTKILKDNQLNIVSGSKESHLDDLLIMLDKGEAKMINRGVYEFNKDLSKHIGKFPDLIANESIMLHYPHYIFFYLSKKNRRLYLRLEDGLKKIVKNGTFNAIFEQYYGVILRNINVQKRRVLKINNPDLLSGAYLKNHKLFYSWRKK